MGNIRNMKKPSKRTIFADKVLTKPPPVRSKKIRSSEPTGSISIKIRGSGNRNTARIITSGVGIGLDTYFHKPHSYARITSQHNIHIDIKTKRFKDLRRFLPRSLITILKYKKTSFKLEELK